jgi:hypothetical protein
MPRFTRVGSMLAKIVESAAVGMVVSEMDGHMVYGTEYRQPVTVGVAYLVATGLPLLLSSQRTVVVLGAIVLAGLLVAYAFYWEAFTSVWCFFAAAASTAILGHFEWSHRRRLRIAGA